MEATEPEREAIYCKAVNKWFPGAEPKHAVDDMTLAVDYGEVFGLLGPVKTMLLLLLLLLLLLFWLLLLLALLLLLLTSRATERCGKDNVDLDADRL